MPETKDGEPDGARKVIRRVAGNTGMVALTFDDGPDPVYTPQVLAILRSYGVKGTFFLVTGKARKYPDVVQAILAAGHHVACHGLNHAPHTLLTRSGTAREVMSAAEILAEITGRWPKYYRPPWGLLNRWTVQAVRAADMEVVLWSCDSRDWLWWTSPASIVQRVLSCPAVGGGIILCHDGTFIPQRPRRLVGALPGIIGGLLAKGLKLADLPTLLSCAPLRTGLNVGDVSACSQAGRSRG